MKERRFFNTNFSVWSNYRYVYKNMWDYNKSLLWYGLAEILSNVLAPLGNIVIPAMVVGLLVKKVTILKFIGLLILIFIIYGMITAVNSYLISRNRMQYIDVRCNRFWDILSAKYINIDYQLMEKANVRNEMEKAIYCLSTNNDGMEGFMHKNVSLTSNVFGFIIYALIISTIQPLILALLILLSLIQLVVYNKAKRYEYNKRDEMAQISVTQSYLQEQAFDLRAGKDIRLYQLNKLILRVYENANQRIKKLKIKIQSMYYLNDVAGIVLRFLRDGVCYGYLIYLLVHGMEVSHFVLYLGVISGFAGWIMKIADDISEIGRYHLTICDFRRFIEMEDLFSHKDGKELEDSDIALDIIFDHVSFRYDGAQYNTLDNISFHIKKGERLALVGINGAGKTTIVKLMCGLYRPSEGRILINGIDMKELNIEKYFRRIAVVFQDPLTISFTIAENISGTFDDRIDRDKVTRVMELSGIKTKVEQLNKGMDTFLNKDMEESGVQLSGGEIQKLMLARALYKNAKLLILDEPTAALDSLAESELYEKYQTLLQGRTSLFISHRLASTRFCNYIVFLEKGKIIEEGSHNTLMEQKGRYAEMFQAQSKYYMEEESYEGQKSMA